MFPTVFNVPFLLIRVYKSCYTSLHYTILGKIIFIIYYFSSSIIILMFSYIVSKNI